MKVKNKLIDIQIGKKSVRKHNFFLDSYLTEFSKCQYVFDYNDKKDLSYGLYIKLDTPLENVEYDSVLEDTDFDMYIRRGNLQTIKNSNNLSAIYSFSNAVSFYLLEEGSWVEYTDRSILDDRKITAISFSLQTFLDTAEYELYFADSEILNIVREDLIVTDAIYQGEDDFATHLNINNMIEYESGGAVYETPLRTRLYSVGLGYNIGQMQEEYIIGEDVENVEVNVEDDFTYSFLITKAVDSGIYPSTNMQPMTTLHPRTFKIKTSIYPNPRLYAGNNLYPRAGDYKYIIMKYKDYYINRGSEIVDTKTYTMSFYTNKEGLLTVKDKIERSDA